MTSPSDPTDDGQTSPGDNLPPTPEQQSASDVGSAPAGDEMNLDTATAVVDEGLPEWEPLTPELVEDEAIRGDFVIRWAVVGLALLFGFSQIVDSRTLVHIKSGQYLATHGVLPPANDVFSYTASERRWINLPWLFDLFVAGVYQLGGGIGLSIVQGLLAGVAFGLLANAQRIGIRTWWGSICAVLALLVCYPQITMLPELITLIGLAATLWIVLRSDDASSPSPRQIWLAVPLIWVWSQFDNRAFLGWLFLFLMAAGESLRAKPFVDDPRSRAGIIWWRVAGASLLVAVIHPFLWETWLSPVRLYFADYPALRQLFLKPAAAELPFFSIAHPQLWITINHSTISALVLFAATVIALVLNRERMHPGEVLAVVIYNGLACLTTHELAAASLVNCAVCAVNAQSWYRHRFGQIYSVDWRELLFSRGGRAVTVLSFFALAWLVISGRIDGAGGKRTGIGFDEALVTQMKDYNAIADNSLDDRPFHFAVRQGDLLIWAGQKSFVDNRASLFRGAGDQDLIEIYDRTRRALQQKRERQPGSGERDVWQETFAKYKITHAMPRLTGPIPPPDYTTFGDLLSSTDWILTDLFASTAVFYRNDPQSDDALKEFVDKHRLQYVEKAFRTEVGASETVRDWAKPATAYDNLFSLRRPSVPTGVLAGQHLIQLAGSGGDLPMPVRAAFATMAIRQATAGLREAPNCADGYRVLGLAHLILDRVESGVMAETKTQWIGMSRYFQAIAAFQQAAALRPESVDLQYDMMSLFEKMGRTELTLETVRQIKKLQPYSPKATDEERQQRERLLDLELSLEETVNKVKDMSQQALGEGADRLQIASAVFQSGSVLTAIRILEEDAIYKEQNLAAKTMLGGLLLEAGRVREAHETLEAVEQVSAAGNSSNWRDSVAFSALSNGDYLRAIRLWRAQIRETDLTSSQASLMTLPFVTLNPYWLGPDQYPMTHMAAVAQLQDNSRNEVSALRFQIAMTQIESGDIKGAAATIQQSLDHHPTSYLRPLLRFYLFCLTDKLIEEKIESGAPAEEFEELTQVAAPADSAAKDK